VNVIGLLPTCNAGGLIFVNQTARNFVRCKVAISGAGGDRNSQPRPADIVSYEERQESVLTWRLSRADPTRVLLAALVPRRLQALQVRQALRAWLQVLLAPQASPALQRSLLAFCARDATIQRV